MPERKRHYFAKIPTMALLFLLALLPELAIILFILRSIDRKAEQQEEAELAAYMASRRATEQRWSQADARRYAQAPNTRQNAAAEAAKAPMGQAPRSAPTPEPGFVSPTGDVLTREQKKSRDWQSRLIKICGIVGGLFLLIGISDISDAFSYFSFMPFWSTLLEDMIPAIMEAVGGGGMLGLSFHLSRTRRLETQLDRIVGQLDNISLKELFAAAGISDKTGRRVLHQAIEHGYFGADAYIDNRTDTLVVRGAAPQPAKAAPEPVPEVKKAPVAESEYESLLRQLREVNDIIPDPVMTMKISRLEALTARIFEQADRDPKKRPQLQRFMEYYLPTSLKLLNSYAQLGHQDLQGGNVLEARRSIERSMDMLVSAFENQLDKLYQTETLDITSDIAALQGMLSLDGLVDSHDFDASAGL